MNLKEKFDNPIMRHDLCRNEIKETKQQCAEIAEVFAIGFAEFITGITHKQVEGYFYFFYYSEWKNQQK